MQLLLFAVQKTTQFEQWLESKFRRSASAVSRAAGPPESWNAARLTLPARGSAQDEEGDEGEEDDDDNGANEDGAQASLAEVGAPLA
jgi:hypothetical protein